MHAHGCLQAAHQSLRLPRTRQDCLPYVFELAGKYGIKVIAMEITHESHLNEILEALDQPASRRA